LLTKRVVGCTTDTLRTCRWWLEQFLAAGPDVGVLAVRAFFARLPWAEVRRSILPE
jgi:hypothetical protein